MSYESSGTKASKVDVINMLGVRTKKSPREGQSLTNPKGGIKQTAREKKSLAVETPWKTPTKNNKANSILNYWEAQANNR